MQRVCGVIGALDINLGKKEFCFPGRSLNFPMVFCLLSVEVAFIEQLYSHWTSGTLFYKRDMWRLGCGSPDVEYLLPGLCCTPQPCSDPEATGWMAATSLQCQNTVSGKKNTKY